MSTEKRSKLFTALAAIAAAAAGALGHHVATPSALAAEPPREPPATAAQVEQLDRKVSRFVERVKDVEHDVAELRRELKR